MNTYERFDHDRDEFVVWRRRCGWRWRVELFRTVCDHGAGACPYAALDMLQGGARLADVPTRIASPGVLTALAVEAIDSMRTVPPVRVVTGVGLPALFDQEA